MANSPITTGLSGRCPNCGEGALFSGFLEFHKDCAACGISYESEDAGDGPAVFVIFIVGIFIVPLVLLFHFATNAPSWLTFVIWTPIIILICLFLLRMMRGILFNIQYVQKAKEATYRDIKSGQDKS